MEGLIRQLPRARHLELTLQEEPRKLCKAVWETAQGKVIDREGHYTQCARGTGL